MTDQTLRRNGTVRIDVFLGGAPLIESRFGTGLLEFGLRHPQWRFSMRGADFRYTRRWLREQAIDGVLALIDAGPAARVLDRAGIPWVHVMPGRALSRPCVNVDDLAIGRMGADFFLGKGLLRSAFCGVGTCWSDRRAEGFRTRMEEAGRHCSMEDFPFSQDRDWGLAQTSEQSIRDWIVALPPGTAVMAAHDALANRIVDLCIQLRRRVPQDIAVLGVGNHDLLCQLSPVPISSVDAAVPQVALQSCALLAALIGVGRTDSVVPVAPRGIVERRSTEIAVYGDALVARIVAYIRDHVGEPLGVADLLDRFPVARRTLSRRFARYVGHSPSVEIQKARIRKACELLRRTRMPLADIAAACGYADLPHLSRAIRKETRQTPGGIRRAPLGPAANGQKPWVF